MNTVYVVEEYIPVSQKFKIVEMFKTEAEAAIHLVSLQEKHPYKTFCLEYYFSRSDS